MRANRRRRALVALEPELLRNGIEYALAVEGGFELMPASVAEAIGSAGSRRLLLHPSARPDIVIALPGMAAELASLDFSVIEVPPEVDAPIVAYAGRAEIARVAPSLRAIVELAQTLGGVERGSAATS
jgi:hypothetical protein